MIDSIVAMLDFQHDNLFILCHMIDFRLCSIKGVPNMILVKVICYVNMENHFLTFEKHMTFSMIMLGIPFIEIENGLG